MIKIKLLSFCAFLLVLAITQNASAQDVDYTSVIINSNFEHVAEGVPFSTTGENYPTFPDGTSSFASGAWRPVINNKTTLADHLEFYGWQLSSWDWMWKNNLGVGMEKINSQSIGISAVPSNGTGNGVSCAWINGNRGAMMPADFEFFQIIDKDLLPAGIYKVQCRLGPVAGNRFTTQRLFANQNVQFFGTEAAYPEDMRTPGEIYTCAGYSPEGFDVMKELTVYVTLGEEDSLKIGIRSGNPNNVFPSATGDNMVGAFKMDYFRLTKLDISAKLSALSLPVGILSPEFDPEITEYTATIPSGLPSITPEAEADETFTLTGTEAVDVSSGSGVSTIVVTSVFDETSSRTYTINYVAGSDVDYTNLVINNSFEYASDGTLLDANSDGMVDDSHEGKGKDSNGYRVKNSVEKEYYAWRVSNWDFASETNTSQGMNRDVDPVAQIHGTYATWLGGDLQFKVDGADTNTFEFYQIIDKDALPAGTYKLQCRLAVANNKRTSQRLFANNSVQYHGTETQHAGNQTTDETATFAGWPDGEKNLQEMVVYVTIAEEDSLKIGIRTGNIKGDGSIAANANPLWGWFKTDYFRLTKLDTDAKLSALSLPVGSLSPEFDPEVTEYTALLPAGTQSIAPEAEAGENFTLTGTEAVDVSSGSGVSTLVVTSKYDGTKVKTYTISYTVNVPVTGVSLNETSAELEVNETLQLTATITPDNATNKGVTWGSDNAQVADVSSSGLVTARTVGTATITVTTDDGALESSCEITVILGTGAETPDSQPARASYTRGLLRLVNLEGYTVTLFSVDGQTLARFQIGSPDASVPQTLPDGLYFLLAQKGADRKVFKIIGYSVR
jgi:uncharacterized protein YjdB